MTKIEIERLEDLKAKEDLTEVEVKELGVLEGKEVPADLHDHDFEDENKSGVKSRVVELKEKQAQEPLTAAEDKELKDLDAELNPLTEEVK